jgi:hypothetical protein
MEHAELRALEEGMPSIRGAPSEIGRVELIVRRPGEGEREVLDEARLDPVEGLVGDNWLSRGSRATRDGSAHPDMQLTLMNARVTELVARGRECWPLAGDQLYVDFDLSSANVPPGTRLALGSAIIEITAIPHTGCGKFARRFGTDAARFINSKVGRELNMRGVNAKIVAAGTVRAGGRISKEASPVEPG